MGCDFMAFYVSWIQQGGESLRFWQASSKNIRKG
jgi:hypothetical protein